MVSADDAVGAHQARGRDGLHEVLRDERVDGRHAGDVDDGDRGARVDDLLQDVFHHHLGARRVQRADQRQRQDAVPQLHDRRRQLQQFLLLAHDDLVAGALEHLDGVQAHLVEQRADDPRGIGQRGRIAGEALAHAGKQRLLQREHEARGLARGRAVPGAGRGNLAQDVAYLVPRAMLDVLQFAAARGLGKGRQELLAVLAQLVFRDDVRPHGQRFQLLDPFRADVGFVILDELADAVCVVLGRHLSSFSGRERLCPLALFTFRAILSNDQLYHPFPGQLGTIRWEPWIYFAVLGARRHTFRRSVTSGNFFRQKRVGLEFCTDACVLCGTVNEGKPGGGNRLDLRRVA
jgi:hypothetical protein